MSGLDVARRLRAEFPAEDLLLVAVTGHGQAGDYRLSEEAGFDHHLVKPLGPDALDGLLGVTSWVREAYDN